MEFMFSMDTKKMKAIKNSQKSKNMANTSWFFNIKQNMVGC